MNETMTQAVQAGAQLLDEHNPDWRTRVDPQTLNMAYHGFCLLSQVFRSFEEGIEQLELGSLLGEDVRDSDGWEYGFTLAPWTDTEHIKEEYALLTAEWKKQLGNKIEEGK